MRILLTGGTGFLGRHFVAAARNHTLILATRGNARNGTNEISLGSGPWSRADFLAALEKTRPDVVVHGAGTSSAADPVSMLATNVGLAADLLNAAATFDAPPRVLLIGSAAEYGPVPNVPEPVAETMPCAPNTLYGISKYAQTLLGLAANARDMPVLVVRIFNVVGPGMPAHLALPSFARQLVGPEARSVLRVGNLKSKRDFVDVEAAASVLVALAERAEWPWPLINLCSGHSYGIGELLDALIAVSGAKVTIEVDAASLRPDTASVIFGSTKRLAALGLAPPPPSFANLWPVLLEEARARTDQPPASVTHGR